MRGDQRSESVVAWQTLWGRDAHTSGTHQTSPSDGRYVKASARDLIGGLPARKIGPDPSPGEHQFCLAARSLQRHSVANDFRAGQAMESVRVDVLDCVDLLLWLGCGVAGNEVQRDGRSRRSSSLPCDLLLHLVQVRLPAQPPRGAWGGTRFFASVFQQIQAG